jgi:hypothetical protein
MTRPQLADVPVHSAEELTARITVLVDPPVFGARSLWLLWLDPDGLQLPLVVPIDDVPLALDPRLPEGLLTLHDGALDGASGFHLAMVLCRPGRPTPTGDDHEWAEQLRRAFDGELDGTWSLHLAAGGSVTPLVEAPPEAWER